MTSSPASDVVASQEKTPTAVRVSAVLAGLVGAFTLWVAFTVGISEFNPYNSLGWLPLATALVAGLGGCIAAVLIWRSRRLGVLILVLAWAVPTFTMLALGQQARGNILLTACLLLAASNWKSLR